MRFRPDTLAEHSLPAAGLPWFMALFGRDSLITSYQMLPFKPELAGATLRALAAAQGKKEVELTEEEPGRILHELRFGELTHFHERPQAPYYGASDTTLLFLVLLDEYERWTGDVNLVRALEANARAALNWMEHFGDRDGDGYIEYRAQDQTRPREPVLEGLLEFHSVPRRDSCADTTRDLRTSGLCLRCQAALRASGS